jgi:hypothetical protein
MWNTLRIHGTVVPANYARDIIYKLNYKYGKGSDLSGYAQKS